MPAGPYPSTCLAHIAAAGLLAAALVTAHAQQPPAEVIATGATAGETIDDVLDRSQRMQLDALQPADATSARARAIQASFDRLAVAARSPHAVRLMVMRGGVQAHAMLGSMLVVGEAVGDLPENERLMLLSHELAHLWLDHWQAMHALYRRHIPGAVRPETTDPVAGALGREAHDLAHKQELEADAFGYTLAHRLGVSLDDATSLLMRQPQVGDSATHPATRRRLAQLRAIELQSGEAERLGGASVSARTTSTAATTR